jgi:Papain family cysteine protease
MAPDLPALRRATDELGLRWQPGETVHADYSRLRAVSRLGAVPPGGQAALAQRAENAASRFAAELISDEATVKAPASFDWRSVKGANYVSPIKDQGGCGSCVAFGATAVLESMVRIQAKEPALIVNLSEAQVFFCYGPDHGAGACPEGGWWPDDAFPAMKKGVVDEANFIYTDVDQPCHHKADWKSRLTTFKSWTTRTSVASIKSYLATVGPMSACFTIYEDFFYNYVSGIYQYHPKTSGDIIGGHCVTIVGYDDADKCWIAKNSWGTGWGEDGYFRIAYGSAGIDEEMWGIDGVVASPLIRTTLRVVGGSGGNLWHTARKGSGSWSALAQIDAAPLTDPGKFTQLSVAATINALHVVGLVGGKPWHTVRRVGLAWSKFARPTSTLPSGVTKFDAISCAAVGDTLHVVGVANGSLWHARRTTGGTWGDKWVRVMAAANDPGTFTAVSAGRVGKGLHVVAVANGGLSHTIMNTDGTWPAKTKQIPSTTDAVTAVSIAGVDSALHVVALAGGKLWHIIRASTGKWQPEFLQVSSTGGGTFTSVACADVGTRLQVVGLASGELWHTIRAADGSWQNGFGNVNGVLSSVPGTFSAVDCG